MENTIKNTIDWDNSSNASIKMELEAIKHQQKTVVDKMVTLSKNLEELEKEYYYGNKILIKRYKGEV
jgi:hypothetical protein|tara:strand:+ start:929 stop:1129 length:201 start_codon:yes stop_codon:yes gene_type:complete